MSKVSLLMPFPEIKSFIKNTYPEPIAYLTAKVTPPPQWEAEVVFR